MALPTLWLAAFYYTTALYSANMVKWSTLISHACGVPASPRGGSLYKEIT